MRSNAEHRREVVTAFCEECVWARSVRTHFAVLFESGKRRHELLAEVANTFFGDLNTILIEYLLLQQCKLTDPASSGKNKDNLTTNYILTLGWPAETAAVLRDANDYLMEFRSKVVDARRKLVAHSDLKTRVSLTALGTFTEEEESSFWSVLQRFVNAAHEEAIGGPFEITASMPDGDAASLVHSLIEAVDYHDLVGQERGFVTRRYDKKRYKNA
jgi:hypothetical protein